MGALVQGQGFKKQGSPREVRSSVPFGLRGQADPQGQTQGQVKGHPKLLGDGLSQSDKKQGVGVSNLKTLPLSRYGLVGLAIFGGGLFLFILWRVFVFVLAKVMVFWSHYTSSVFLLWCLAILTLILFLAFGVILWQKRAEYVSELAKGDIEGALGVSEEDKVLKAWCERTLARLTGGGYQNQPQPPLEQDEAYVQRLQDLQERTSWTEGDWD